MLAALILSLAGASDEAIARDYGLTKVGMGGMKEAIIRHLVDEPAMKGVTRDEIEMMVASE